MQVLLKDATSNVISQPIGTLNSPGPLVHVYSTTTSSAVVTIEQSIDKVAWFVVKTVTNPTSAGELWTVGRANWTRVRVSSYASGLVQAVAEV